MSGIAAYVVRMAAALLPARLRDRYREQWLGELRDAPTLGVRTSDIALGSLAFTASLARPLPGRPLLSIEQIRRRARLSITLSASAAVLAVTQYASPGVSAPTSSDLVGSTIATLVLMLTLYWVLAPLAAIFLALSTRGIGWRARGGVLLLSAACASPLAFNAIANQVRISAYAFYVPLGTIFLPAALALVGLAALALWRRRRPFDPSFSVRPVSRRMFGSTLAGVAVAMAATGAFIWAFSMWVARTPLKYRKPITTAERSQFAQWLAQKASVEQMIATTLVVWLVAGLVLACAVAVSGLSRRSSPRSSWILSIGAVGVVSLSFGSVVSFLQEVSDGIAPGFPIDLTTVLGQLWVTVVILAGVGRQHDAVGAAPGAQASADRAAIGG